jgi:hypothetical protein
VAQVTLKAPVAELYDTSKSVPRTPAAPTGEVMLNSEPFLSFETLEITEPSTM